MMTRSKSSKTTQKETKSYSKIQKLITKELQKILNGEQDRYVFSSSLTSFERHLVHEAAAICGLNHVSFNTYKNERRIKVFADCLPNGNTIFCLSEDISNELQKILDGEKESHVFTCPLTSAERQIIHKEAEKYGLNHESFNDEKNVRRIKVSFPKRTTKRFYTY